MLLGSVLDPFFIVRWPPLHVFVRPVAVNIYTPSDVHLSLLRHMYHVNTEFAYGERKNELNVLEATFFYH